MANHNHPYNSIIDRTPKKLSPSMETLCSDAIHRIAILIGVAVDLDDPEPALVSAVERAVAALVDRANATDTSV